MKVSVMEKVLVYLMLARLAPPAAAEIITGVSLVGGSGSHEGSIQVAVSDADGLPMGTGYVSLLLTPFLPTAICNTLGYPGENRVFILSPYPVDPIKLYDLSCDGETTPTSVIGCRATIGRYRDSPSAVICENVTPPSVTSKLEEQEAITTAMPAETDGDSCFCGHADNAVSVPMATPSSVICKPDKPEATTPVMPAEPDGNSCLCGSADNAVRNAGIGTGVGAVLLAILAMVNVFVYARTRRQAAKLNMVAMTKMKTTAATSTTSNKHEVYQSLTTQPTSDYYTGLDVPSRDQDDGYETPISPGGAHSGASVVALEMGPVYEVMPKTTDSSACSYVNSDDHGRKQEKDQKYVNVRN